MQLFSVFKHFKNELEKYQKECDDKISGFIHYDLNPNNIIRLYDTQDYGIIGFENINFSLYLYDLASCIWNCIIFFLQKNNTTEFNENIKYIFKNILTGYQTLFPFDNYNFLYWSILYTLSLRIIKEEIGYRNKNRKLIDDCWCLFDMIFVDNYLFK
jgi:Ser/Thr protein kinase RdoA (MazF antagonist)